MAEAILHAAGSIRYLTMEYALRHEDRVAAQWWLRYASLTKLLENTTLFSGTDERKLVDEIRRAHQSVDNLFTQIVANHKERVENKRQSRVLEDLDSRLTGQIMNRTQGKISDARTLSERSRAGVLEAQHRANVAVAGSGAIVILVVAAMLFLLHRSVVRPLGSLREGTAVVGGGNLDFRLDVASKDEIGELARAFDAMTEKLKGTTVSHNELAKANAELETEIGMRTRAEERAQGQVERLNLLHQITRAIGERQDLQSIFQVVMRSLEENLPVDFGCVCLLRRRADNALTVIARRRAQRGAGDGAGADGAGAHRHRRRTACRAACAAAGLRAGHRAMRRSRSRSGWRAADCARWSSRRCWSESQVFGVLVAARRAAADLQQRRLRIPAAAERARRARRASGAAPRRAAAGLRRSAPDAAGRDAAGAAARARPDGERHRARHQQRDLAGGALHRVAAGARAQPERRARAAISTTIQRAIDDVAQTVARMREFYRQREPQLALAPVRAEPRWCSRSSTSRARAGATCRSSAAS